MITIGIPAYNEEKNIKKCIRKILDQNLKIPFEIVVISCACTDRTEEIISHLSKKDKRIKLVSFKELVSKPEKMNLLAKIAKGEVIIQTDADVLIERNSISSILKHFNDKSVGLVSGRPVPIIQKNSIFYNWVKMSYKRMHELRMQECKENKFWHVSGYLCGIRKKAYVNIPVGSIIDDAVFGLLIWKNGWKVVYEPDARVLVKAPLTIKDFIRQRARNRAGFYQIRKRYGIQSRSLFEELEKYFMKELKSISSVRELFTFVSIGIIYLLSWIMGFWQIITKQSPLEIWKPIKTTK